MVMKIHLIAETKSLQDEMKRYSELVDGEFMKNYGMTDCNLLEPIRRVDHRGFLPKHSKRKYSELGIEIRSGQPLSRHVGTVRGLHFQATFAQAKLVDAVVVPFLMLPLISERVVQHMAIGRDMS